eukprot:TRINITY_DN15049_c0_g1_i1.p1 TRINITY_DN15049_c0_g1~~TRINITY_DN15049_c0_g1_i1.p1  ORF type:complete len:216 (+),score=21.22 TRINITY_DN15049_c0_g1_i1:182-829(+)
MNGKLVIVGNGTPAEAQLFRKDMQWNGELYLDPSSETYRALGMPRWTKSAVRSRFFTLSAIKFARGIGKNHRSNFKGDGLQSGGVIICQPGAPAPYFIWKEKDNDVKSFVEPQVIRQQLRGGTQQGYGQQMGAQPATALQSYMQSGSAWMGYSQFSHPTPWYATSPSGSVWQPTNNTITSWQPQYTQPHQYNQHPTTWNLLPWNPVQQPDVYLRM